MRYPGSGSIGGVFDISVVLAFLGAIALLVCYLLLARLRRRFFSPLQIYMIAAMVALPFLATEDATSMRFVATVAIVFVGISGYILVRNDEEFYN